MPLSKTLPESLLAQIPADTLSQLQRADQFWQDFRAGLPIPDVVTQSSEILGEVDCDLIICGGTLGIFIGCALQRRGWRVTVIEQGILRGREQEWNISRQELDAFLELDLLTVTELAQSIATEYNPARIAFQNSPNFWVRDVLNIGVDPVFLLETLKTKFLTLGGRLFEHTGFQQAIIHPDGVEVRSQPPAASPFLIPDYRATQLKARLLLDVMGHFSSITRQARQGAKPDGVCMVVGSCATGIPSKEYGDLLVSFTPIQKQCQYFWEAFPARDGRTTYMFTYVDADPSRPSFSELFEDYLDLLPQYQEVDLATIQFKRTLFGFFPAYRNSPLQTPFDRILQVGDSSGNQSPLSFGGFGSMVRHLVRLTEGIEEALTGNLLSKEDLRLLQPYQPNLSVTWLFQKAMSVGIDQNLPVDRINQMLTTVFKSMSKLGDPVLKPFLQDVVQFPALSQTMLDMAFSDPILVAQIVQQVGISALIDWSKHYINLGSYSLLHQLDKNKGSFDRDLSPTQQYSQHRRRDSWQYGSGGDYTVD